MNKPHLNKRKWLCMDCKENTSSMREHYFVKLEVWLAAHPSEQGMLCIGCLETRLGRRLTGEDFTDAFINDPKRNQMSVRLVNRIRS